MSACLDERERLRDRFWRKVELGDGCWIWTGSRDSSGYGVFRLPEWASLAWRVPVICRAHRISWMLKHGPIAGNLSVCHHCDNPSCVRFDHLFLGTDRDNMRDRVAKERLRARAASDRSEPRADTLSGGDALSELASGRVNHRHTG